MPSEVQAREITQLLGLKPGVAADELRLFRTIRRGLPLHSLRRVQGTIAPGNQNVRRLFISDTTLRKRRRRGARLSPLQSQKVVRAARIWLMAMNVYGEGGKARAFLLSPHPMLDQEQPLSLVVENDVGAELVETLLGRLKYTIPA